MLSSSRAFKPVMGWRETALSFPAREGGREHSQAFMHDAALPSAMAVRVSSGLVLEVDGGGVAERDGVLLRGFVPDGEVKRLARIFAATFADRVVEAWLIAWWKKCFPDCSATPVTPTARVRPPVFLTFFAIPIR